MLVKKILIFCLCSLILPFANAVEVDPLYDLPDKPFAHTMAFETVGELRAHLSGGQYRHWAPGLNWDKLEQFYLSQNYQPVWLTDNVPNERATIFRDVLLSAYEEGLDPKEYHSKALRYIWRARRAITKARLELLLTDAFLRYVREVSAGYFNPKSVDFDWKLPGRGVDLLKQLNAYLKSEKPEIFLAELAPAHEAYKKLKQALSNYRFFAKNGGWGKIKHGPLLKPGDQSERIAKIRKRLIVEGFLHESNLLLGFTDVYDDSLEEAVKHFQRVHGHKEDGLIGWSTLRSLNVSVDKRIAEIKKNMERWRWLPEDLGANHVAVNMAGYELQMIENRKQVLHMPVVIGKTVRATPTFIDTLEYLEFNPSWKVPPRIAKEKFLPKLQEDPGFLKVNRLKVYNGWHKSAKEVDPETINWNHYSEDRWFPFKLEQLPGNQNSLGRIKFMFPNKYRIYLHDSPDKELFNRYVRTFSAGCVRVSDPYALAEKILETEGDWTKAKVKDAVATGETQKVLLSKKWPVYLLYWTAWVDDDGFVNFRKDVYQRNINIATGAEPDYHQLLLAHAAS